MNSVIDESTYNMNAIQNLKIEDIPDAWIYKYYYQQYKQKEIIQPFDGRTIRVRSFVSNDSNPSLFFFCKKGRYYWKDFSTGMGGTSLKFIEEIAKLDASRAIISAVIEYEKFIKNKKIFSVEDYEISNDFDLTYEPLSSAQTYNHKNFWEIHKVPITDTLRFGIHPLSGYRLDGYKKNYDIRAFCFGFFKDVANMHQIYQPENKKCKYITIDSKYVKGSRQLEHKYDTCAIVSGLKDIVCITQLGLKCEYIAPPISETTMISPEFMTNILSFYKRVITILDNDPTGIRMMMLYKKMYGYEPVRINLEKDHGENTKKYDLNFLRDHYTMQITKAINK